MPPTSKLPRQFQLIVAAQRFQGPSIVTPFNIEIMGSFGIKTQLEQIRFGTNVEFRDLRKLSQPVVAVGLSKNVNTKVTKALRTSFSPRSELLGSLYLRTNNRGPSSVVVESILIRDFIGVIAFETISEPILLANLSVSNRTAEEHAAGS
jgi:hypothetical protein